MFLIVAFLLASQCVTESWSQQATITRQLTFTTALPFSISIDDMVDSTTYLYSSMNSAFCGILTNALVNSSGIAGVYTTGCSILQFSGTNPISYNASGPSYVSVNALLQFSGNLSLPAALSGINSTLNPSNLYATISSTVSNASWLSSQSAFVQPISNAFNVSSVTTSLFNTSTITVGYFPDCSWQNTFTCSQYANCIETNNNYACQCIPSLYFTDNNPSNPGLVCTEPCSQTSCLNGGTCVVNYGSLLLAIVPQTCLDRLAMCTMAWLYAQDNYLMTLVIAFAVTGGVLILVVILLVLIRRREKKLIDEERKMAENQAQISQHKEVVDDLLIPLSKKKRNHHRRHGSTVGLLHLLKRSRSKQSIAGDLSSQTDLASRGSNASLPHAPSNEEIKGKEYARDHAAHSKHAQSRPALRKTQSHPAFLDAAQSQPANTNNAEGGPIMIKPKFNDIEVATPQPQALHHSPSHLFVPHREQHRANIEVKAEVGATLASPAEPLPEVSVKNGQPGQLQPLESLSAHVDDESRVRASVQSTFL